MLMGLASLMGLGGLVCFVLVLIKQFQLGSVVHGIIGIVTCGLWTFIWGWLNSGKHGLKNVMLIWTALVLLGIVIQVVGVGSMMTAFRH